MPDRLELFTHPGCVSREEGKQFIRSILKDFPHVTFREVDMMAEQKRSAALGIQMSPTMVFNDKIIAVGIPDEQKLRTLIEENIHD